MPKPNRITLTTTATRAIHLCTWTITAWMGSTTITMKQRNRWVLHLRASLGASTFLNPASLQA